MLLYSVVIPMYNSGDWIGDLLDEIQKVMNDITSEYEIIVVNDGSPKMNSWNQLKLAALQSDKVRAVNLGFNVGQIRALMYGLGLAQGKYIITMDDDFQHNPLYIPQLIEKIKKEKSDIVIAQYEKKKDSFIREIGTKGVNFIYYKLYNKPKNIISNSYRIMTRSFAKSILCYKSSHPQMGPIIFLLKPNYSTLAIKHEKRKFGKSGYGLTRLIKEVMNAVISFSTMPFTVFIGLGIMVNILFILAFIIFACIGINKINLTILLFILGLLISFILIGIGLVGKYIGRVLEEQIGFKSILVKNEIRNGKEISEEFSTQ